MITRRRFVQLVGTGAAALATGCGDNRKLPRGLFFDEHQWAANYPTEWYCERCGGELATM
jgi:hypothetical protein